MEKLDLVKTDKEYYSAKKTPEIRNFPSLNFLTLNGTGKPAGSNFNDAVEAIYPLAYGIKKNYKAIELDFAVPKLEGLWWFSNNKNPGNAKDDEWNWKLLIRMPEFVSSGEFEKAKKQVFEKKQNQRINNIKFETLTENKCVQIMHVGPYSKEHITISILEKFISDNNLTKNGLHHEIYLSDPRKIDPEKLKTILRYPVK